MSTQPLVEEELRVAMLALRRVAGASPTKFAANSPSNMKGKNLGVVQALKYAREVANNALDTVMESQHERGEESV